MPSSRRERQVAPTLLRAAELATSASTAALLLMLTSADIAVFAAAVIGGSGVADCIQDVGSADFSIPFLVALGWRCEHC